ncbi:MAG: helix-turn-helix domain-containing protein [Firmicutes bacterium]|nr:helix-turn-helix domain-containing protein [Bacillota bacterium]
MTRNEFISEMNHQLKLVRTEYGFTQDVMAKTLGISKKTLVEIEKGRASLGWTGAVALCTIFRASQVLAGALGGEATDMILALAFEEVTPDYPKTMGGKIWWNQMGEYRGYKIQQNMISGHYRALNQEDERVYSSFELEKVKEHLDQLNPAW